MEDKIKLKQFMQDNFCFSTLKKAKIFPRELKFNDYEGQAKVICNLFELNSVYDYLSIGKGTRYHMSYSRKVLDKDIIPPFVQTIGGENNEECKIVKFEPKNP